jgi:hypothetical protein
VPAQAPRGLESPRYVTTTIEWRIFHSTGLRRITY